MNFTELKVKIGLEKLKIISWNIQGGRDVEGDNALDIQIAYLKRFDADIILLQEVDVYTESSEKRNIIKEIADALGMYSAYGTDKCLRNNGWYGNATLSKRPIDFSMNYTFKGHIETRGILYTKIGIYHVFNAHFSRFLEYRGIMATEFMKLVEHLGLKETDKVILGGDLNCNLYYEIKNTSKIYFVTNIVPLSELSILIDTRYKYPLTEIECSKPTYPSNEPRGILDRFLVRNIKGYKSVHKTSLSDHNLIQLNVFPDDGSMLCKLERWFKENLTSK